ncbi:MAG: DUF554 domain-containing protein [Bacillaceae bacterium]|nr:DUF554 domain-containing protein [Bacillaceae bacterium]
MVLLGTIINTIAIIVGGFVGGIFPPIKENVRQTVMQAIGLSVVVLGVMMAFKTNNFLLVIFSLVIGSLLGEWMKIDDRLNQAGKWLEKKIGGQKKGSVATAFVTATLVYCIGAMAILGALDSGLRLNHDILYTKAMLDGFTAIIFASTLGMGVIFSAVPVFLYQGAIALSATVIVRFLSEDMLQQMIQEITAVGGILIIAIAFNLLELKQIRVANMLPAILIVALGVPLIEYIQSWWTQLLSAGSSFF